MRTTATQIDHTGDLGFEITGPSPEAVLERAGRELFGLMLETDGVRPRESREVTATGDDPTEMWFNWLRALLTLFNVEEFVPVSYDIELDGTTAVARLGGETFDDARHPFHTELKAVTWHDIAFGPEGDVWVGRVILDV